MKKQLTPEQKLYRDNRDRKILGIISLTAIILLGLWMVLDASVKKHARIEKATVALVKNIWGLEAGIVLLVLGGA